MFTKLRRIVLGLLGAIAIGVAFASTAAAADGSPFDPAATAAILAGVFTLAGATVIATIVAGIIQYALKPIGAFGIGTWVDAHEQITALILWAFIVVYAIIALAYPIDLVSLFGYFLAWLGGAKLSSAAYDTAVAAKATLT